VLIDDRGTIKLADFGASKRLSGDGEVSAESDQCAVTLKGTPYFMAPEVIRQTGHGVKVGVLLYTVTFYANLAHSLTRSP
jgi:serine/threonine protein kinase